MWRFESVHGFASVGNLYQKIHFAGSNLSTDPKSPKCAPPHFNHAVGVYEIKAKPCMESATCCGMESSRSDVWHQSEGRIHADAWCHTPAAIPYTTASWLHTNPSDWIEKSTCLGKCFFLAGVAGLELSNAGVLWWPIWLGVNFPEGMDIPWRWSGLTVSAIFRSFKHHACKRILCIEFVILKNRIKIR